VVSVQKPEGWDLIANADSADQNSLPPREQAQAVLDAYLEAAKLRNGHINADYLNSLGLRAP
jgi:hypothetical protein